jgi:hypothetical protein
VETLENRVLLSVTAGLNPNGVLSIVADANPNQVTVTRDDTTQDVVVSDYGNSVGSFAGNQVQLITFRNGASPNTFANTTGIPDKQLRLADSSPLTPAELSQQGSFDALLLDNSLSLTGPSGAGFEIVGSWTDTTIQVGDNYTHTFTASGAMALRTALGDIPFLSPDSDPLTVTTTPAPLLPDFGQVDTISWDSSSTPSLVTTGSDSTLHRFGDQFGLSLSAPSTQWGVMLGSDLTNLGAPLNNAIPYIYFTSTDPSYSAQFGAFTASPSDANPLTVAFDPEDPFIYAHVNEFAVGVSLKGYIPYTPNLSLPGLDTNPIYGQLYGRGPFTLGDISAAVTGEAVINLDAQHDGQLLNTLQGDIASYLVSGSLSLSDFAQAAAGDLRVGINGHADISYTQGGFNITLPVDVSAAYVPGELVAHGTATGDIFAGTPLSFLGTNTTVDVVADISTQSFDLVARVDTATVDGFNSAHLMVELNNQGINAAASMELQYPSWSAEVGVAGTVQPDGQFRFVGQAQGQFAGFLSADALFTLTNNGLAVVGDVDVHLGTVTVPVQFTGVGYILPDGLFRLQGTGPGQL